MPRLTMGSRPALASERWRWVVRGLLLASLGCEWDLAGAPCADAPEPCLTGYVCCEGRCESSCAQSPSELAAASTELGTLSTCSELEPGSSSGLYRIESAEYSGRAYCDAAEGVARCTEMTAEHQAVTKDESALAVELTSVLEGGSCRVWNVKVQQDGRPLDAFEHYDALTGTFQFADPCLPLGLPRAHDFRYSDGCAYGLNRGYGTCGFRPASDGMDLMKWSNGCTGCRVGGGDHHLGYVLQGEIYTSFLPWDASGDNAVVCGP
jgi:hypothetical protein